MGLNIFQLLLTFFFGNHVEYSFHISMSCLCAGLSPKIIANTLKLDIKFHIQNVKWLKGCNLFWRALYLWWIIQVPFKLNLSITVLILRIYILISNIYGACCVLNATSRGYKTFSTLCSLPKWKLMIGWIYIHMKIKDYTKLINKTFSFFPSLSFYPVKILLWELRSCLLN